MEINDGENYQQPFSEFGVSQRFRLEYRTIVDSTILFKIK